MSDKDFNPGLSFCKVMSPFAASIGEMSARNMFSFELSNINHCAATSDEDDRKARPLRGLNGRADHVSTARGSDKGS